MTLTKHYLGEFIERLDIRNVELQYNVDDVRGVSNDKKLMSTKADINGRDLTKFRVVNPGSFVYNHRTSRHGGKFCIAYNAETAPIICTEDYTVFKIKDSCKEILLDTWLFMFFNRPEFDRFVMYSSWGSSTEFFNWDDICSIEIELVPAAIQKRYIDVYISIIENQKRYECGLEDLRRVCDVYIEDLRRKMSCEEIGTYIEESFVKNIDNKYGIESIKGISIKKEFIETKANTNELSATNYNITKPGQFSFNPNTARMGDKFCIAYNHTENDILVSAIYPVFSIKDKEKLCPEYLMMFFMRSEFDRYVRFNSWGSAREMFNYEDISKVKIPIPQYNVQKSIAGIYNVYIERKKINEILLKQIKDICSILIKGSIEEARKTKENIVYG